MRKNDQHTPSEEEVKQWLYSTSQGEQKAFACLLRCHWNKVYTHALTYLKSAPLAQEITQDVFLKIWARREKLSKVNSFADYLFILSRNEIISALRRKKETVTTFPDHAEVILGPEQQLEQKECYNTLLNLINRLPPIRKKVFTMSRLEGKSYEEIGSELGISRNGVKDHIVKALNFLRSHSRAYEEELLTLAVVATLAHLSGIF